MRDRTSHPSSPHAYQLLDQRGTQEQLIIFSGTDVIPMEKVFQFDGLTHILKYDHIFLEDPV